MADFGVNVVPTGPSDPDSDAPVGAATGSGAAKSGRRHIEYSHRCVVIDPGNAHVGKLPMIRVRGKEYEVCWRSCFVFPLNHWFRQWVISCVEWKWFDRFILFLILVNSIVLAAYQWRSPEDTGFNGFVNAILEPILTGFFTTELLFKVVAWGFILDRKSYLRDTWNWLDFVVVVSAWFELLQLSDGLSFLRLFRILRPLRSLNALPQMKVLVNTIIGAVPRLGSVILMAMFLFVLFGIIGMNVFEGIFYRQCHVTEAPVLRFVNGSSGPQCWEWIPTGDTRLCGGQYMCKDPDPGIEVGFCGGHELDSSEDLKPHFPGGKRGFPWCDGSEFGASKIFPETDFIHFDHMGGALLTVIQSTTLEGWTVIMHQVQDGFDFWASTCYFFLLIPVASFFLLNVALAVVDEARADSLEDEETEKAEEAEAAEMERKESLGYAEPGGLPPGEDDDDDAMEDSEQDLFPDATASGELWLDCLPVRILRSIAFNEIFTNFIMLIIAGNVITMSIESYPPNLNIADFLEWTELTFLGIFCVELVVMLGAMGPVGYVKNPVTCFDGAIVLISLVQRLIGGGGGSAFTALRTLRLFRVLNKLANRWPSFRVLLKAMVQTGISLNYWLILFVLMLYIFTLAFMSFFAKRFHFVDDSFGETTDDVGQSWCIGAKSKALGFGKEDCIPRAHFDTFLWAFITIFQIMTGENWNAIMYAGMRVLNPPLFAAILFVLVLVFGQTLILSMFLSMLMSKFDEVQDSLEQSENEKQKLLKKKAQPETNKERGGWFRKITGSLSTRVMPAPDAEAANSSGTSGNSNASFGGKEKAILPGQVVSSPAMSDDEGSPKKGDPSSPLAGHSDTLAPKPWQADMVEDSGDSAAVVEDDSQCHDKLDSPPKPKQAPETPKGSPEPIIEADAIKPKPVKKHWPHGYSFFIFSETNPLRRLCWYILEKGVVIFGQEVKVFDNFILLCIVISSLCMFIDSPLHNPDWLHIKIMRQADRVFAIIFIVEMSLKLIAMGVVWGEHAYLKNGWNWLDGVVVSVSIIDMVANQKNGILKILRILRAFRPLRAISRYETLKCVVNTIFASMPDLFTLVIVCLVFLLIFALFAKDQLAGMFFECQVPDDMTIYFTKDFLPPAVAVTPLCIGGFALETLFSSYNVTQTACPRGQYLESSRSWILGQWDQACPTDNTNCPHSGAWLNTPWQRPTADTPICIGRCDPWYASENKTKTPEWLCPKKLESNKELPNMCGGGLTGSLTEAYKEEEAVGVNFVQSMQRQLVMPCGGSTVREINGVEQEYRPPEASALSCRENFCPEGGEDEETCQANCKKDPFLCVDTCKDDENSLRCQVCRKECVAACVCADFCQPLIKDAAICHEQGGVWAPSLSQNFDNIWNSLLTLFEISSTEGWVDVMYVAVDTTEVYMQPERDNRQWIFAPFFSFWIFFSFMFLLNLSVGVIVDKFMDLKESGNAVLLTDAQKRWISSKKNLFGRTLLFNLTHLDTLPKFRRRVYEFISEPMFENAIMAAIVINTVFMGMKIFPAPTTWWESVLQVINYFFAGIFTIEFGLKLYALRSQYWKDNWNRFDFVCVMATYIGIIITEGTDLKIGAVAAVIRIFRIARLFRLLRVSKRLNKIFTAFVLSLPKLGNVMMILLLFMLLYSILGVQMFSTAKLGSVGDSTLNIHGNFHNFTRAFITLFRATTGEAWNEIMHDMAKNEVDYFRAGDWCSPDGLFDTTSPENWQILNDKCLIDNPNMCVQRLGPYGLMPAIYWITYYLIMSLIIMNLVIAVILEGYADGASAPEAEVVDACLKTWRKFDPDHRMSLPFLDALRFIDEVVAEKAGVHLHELLEVPASPGASTSPKRSLQKKESFKNLTTVPMKYAKALQLTVTEDGMIHFLQASKQVLRFCSVAEGGVHLLEELGDCEGKMTKKDLDKLQKMEVKRSKGMDDRPGTDVTEHVAAIKLQTGMKKAWNFAKDKKKEAHSAQAAASPSGVTLGVGNAVAVGASAFAGTISGGDRAAKAPVVVQPLDDGQPAAPSSPAVPPASSSS